MTSIKIENKTALIYGNLNIPEYSQASNLIKLLNEDILPNLNYNSNITYYIPFGSNSCITYNYGWCDQYINNSNVVLIPNLETNTIDITNKYYFSDIINLPPSYAEYSLPEIYIPYLSSYSEEIIEYIKKIIYSFNNQLIPINYIPDKPYFNVDEDNNILLYSDDNKIIQEEVIDILKNVLFPIWENLNLSGNYMFYLPNSITLSKETIIEYIKAVLLLNLDVYDSYL
jgi:hypothetical protein